MPTDKEKNPILTRIGENIKKYRKAKKNFKGKNYTQMDLAFATGLSYSEVNHLEIGHRNVTILSLYKVAKVLEVTISDLVEGVDQKLDN